MNLEIDCYEKQVSNTYKRVKQKRFFHASMEEGIGRGDKNMQQMFILSWIRDF